VYLLASEARAVPGAEMRPRLEYARGPGAEACPDEASVRRAIAGRLGYDPFSDGGSRVLDCRIDAVADGLRAEISARGTDGAVNGLRALSSRDASCRELAPALLLVLTVAARAPETPPPLDARPPPSPPTPSLPTVAIARAGAAPVPRPPLHLRAGAALFVTDGSLPGASAGGALSLGAARGPNVLSLEIGGEAPRSLALAGGQTTVWRASAALVSCRSGRVLLGCALAIGGLLHGAGEGISDARAATGPWLALGARLGTQFALAPTLALELRADAVVPVVRTRLLVGASAVWTTPAVSAALGLALTRTFQ
jgi:hypothetical protein